jgi:hypothetical protein
MVGIGRRLGIYAASAWETGGVRENVARGRGVRPTWLFNGVGACLVPATPLVRSRRPRRPAGNVIERQRAVQGVRPTGRLHELWLAAGPWELR